jgi:riboflavin kinase/FMN adenylyltransferase
VQFYFGLDGYPEGPVRPVVTIGSFDGIHRGHQALLERVCVRARQRDGTSVLLTFEPHPQHVIAPESAPRLLTLREEKLTLLEKSGLDRVVVLPFDRTLSEMEAEDFVHRILIGRMGVEMLVLGHDHAFGRGRRGRPEMLRQLAPVAGFDLEVMEAVVDRAAALLGRPYSMSGVVARGEGRGRRLGFPTANLALPSEEKCTPGNGVYAVRAGVSGRTFDGVCNVGVRPTFAGTAPSYEIHLFGIEGDLYGASLEMWFYRKLRDEQSFDGPEELSSQIAMDVTEARRILAQEVV